MTIKFNPVTKKIGNSLTYIEADTDNDKVYIYINGVKKAEWPD